MDTLGTLNELEMRTVKHQLKPFSVSEAASQASEQKTKFFDVFYAYQFEKNYFSDQLLNRHHEALASLINLESSYIQIRDKLVKNNYQSKYNLPARLWKMALKEAYELHIRTHEAQVALIKTQLNSNIYQYCKFELSESEAAELAETVAAELTDELAAQQDKNDKLRRSSEAAAASSALNSFENFLNFATNSLFFNFKTFRKFEAEYFSKKFKKARIYQRAKTILLDFLKRNQAKIVEQKVLTKEEIKQLKQLLELGSFTSTSSFTDSDSNALSLCNRLFEHYCYGLVKAIQTFRGFKPIQSKINSTITLDGDCYNLYSKYDDEARKNRWFLDIMSMENGKRIKDLELTGFHHSKQIMKHRKAANLTISFDPSEASSGFAFAHFTFPVRRSQARSKKYRAKKSRSQKAYVSKRSVTHKVSEAAQSKLATLTTVGGDFGLTECFTFSDGWVVGRTQREVLKKITDSTKKDIERIQSNSKKNYFGLEKNNPTNKRNHTKNCFNHNCELHNINTNYRKRQKRYNSHLENYKHQIVSDIINHFTTDNEHGCYSAYASIESNAQLTLVFEDLTYTNLGRTKEDKRQINLIKGVLTLLEEKIKLYNLPIKIQYVNPSYTSQCCPNCYYVDRKNRNSNQSNFRCLHCGFTANEDERYKELTRGIFREHLPAEDERSFVAAYNIAERATSSVLPNSMKLHRRKIKDLLMEKHEQVKGYCKMFNTIKH